MAESRKEITDYPPILTSEEAAELARVPLKTIHVWSSHGHLASCSKKRGRRLLIDRDKFMEELFNGKKWQ